MLRLLAPALQTFPAKADEVRITLSPEQKLNGLALEILGVAGRG
jgi:hypothetical protein